MNILFIVPKYLEIIKRQIPRDYTGDNYYINDYSLAFYDLVIIYDEVDFEVQVKHIKGGLIFYTGEPEGIKKYKYSFTKQFDIVVTSQKKLQHRNKLFRQQALPWLVGLYIKSPLSYDQFKNIEYKKSKTLAIICSNKTITPAHKKRIDFAYFLKSNLGEEIDIFGSGINPFVDKLNVLADYKYCITIENSSIENYWTEKLSDCFLVNTYPIYWGCPNLHEYFSESCFSAIDLDNFDISLNTIKKILANNTYEKNYLRLLEAKQLVLDKYNIIFDYKNLPITFSNNRIVKSTIKKKKENKISIIKMLIKGFFK